MPSTVSCWLKLSRGVGVPRMPARRPVSRTDAEYGSPPSPESNQWVTTSASGSTPSDGGACSPDGWRSSPPRAAIGAGIAPGDSFDPGFALLAAAAALRRAALLSTLSSLVCRVDRFGSLRDPGTTLCYDTSVVCTIRRSADHGTVQPPFDVNLRTGRHGQGTCQRGDGAETPAVQPGVDFVPGPGHGAPPALAGARMDGAGDGGPVVFEIAC